MNKEDYKVYSDKMRKSVALGPGVFGVGKALFPGFLVLSAHHLEGPSFAR